MNKLLNEALQITQELGDVIFVGALATYMHTKHARDSQDLDFVVQKPISDDELLSKGYHKSMSGKQPWYTPRGVKIDIYARDIPGVSFDVVVKNSEIFPIKNKGKIRVLGLESLIVAKHTAQRDQDAEDLKNIAKNRLQDIDWNVIRSIARDDFKADLIRKEMSFLAKS